MQLVSMILGKPVTAGSPEISNNRPAPSILPARLLTLGLVPEWRSRQ